MREQPQRGVEEGLEGMTMDMGRGCLVVVVWTACGACAMAAQGAQAFAASAVGGAAPSAMLAPAVSVLKQALATVKVEKWKGAAAVKEEADRNVGSIERDLDGTLPELLAAADAAPDSAARVLPAFRNLEALYDVLLRVEAVSRVAAPAEQSSALGQALTSLDGARRSLGDKLQADVAAEDKRVGELQAAVKTAQATPVAAAAPVCPAAPAVKKKKPAAKANAAPAGN